MNSPTRGAVGTLSAGHDVHLLVTPDDSAELSRFCATVVALSRELWKEHMMQRKVRMASCDQTKASEGRGGLSTLFVALFALTSEKITWIERSEAQRHKT